MKTTSMSLILPHPIDQTQIFPTSPREDSSSLSPMETDNNNNNNNVKTHHSTLPTIHEDTTFSTNTLIPSIETDSSPQENSDDSPPLSTAPATTPTSLTPHDQQPSQNQLLFQHYLKLHLLKITIPFIIDFLRYEHLEAEVEEEMARRVSGLMGRMQIKGCMLGKEDALEIVGVLDYVHGWWELFGGDELWWWEVMVDREVEAERKGYPKGGLEEIWDLLENDEKDLKGSFEIWEEVFGEWIV